MQRLVQCFLDTDMRNQHDGLAKLAAKRDVNVYKLRKGEHIVFINGKLNRVKMFSKGGVLSYLKLRKGMEFNLDTLRKIPEAFNESESFELIYSKALKSAIREKLGK